MKKEYFHIFGLLLLLICIPLGIRAYDRSLKPSELPFNTKEFILTGHSQKGWLLGEVQAHDILSLFKTKQKSNKPLIRVSKNDQVVLKLRSSDVTHGFTLKAYGIYIPRGIEPGRTKYVRFKADKEGSFVFACNVFCGDIHHSIQGHSNC